VFLVNRDEGHRKLEIIELAGHLVIDVDENTRGLSEPSLRRRGRFHQEARRVSPVMTRSCDEPICRIAFLPRSRLCVMLQTPKIFFDQIRVKIMR
jgi:hypothetical protein